MKVISASLVIALVSLPSAGISAQGLPVGQVRPMTVGIAKQLVAAAIRAACSPPAAPACSGAYAVADDAGTIVYLETLDGVLGRAPELAITKAKASAIWRRPTSVFQDAVNEQTNTAYADGTFLDMTTSRGGITLFKEGRVVGAIGLAGGGGAQARTAVIEEAVNIFGNQEPR